jgi:hypothetical protein
MNTENLLDFVGYMPKWHGIKQMGRKKYKYSQNDYLIQEIFDRIGTKNGFFVEFGAWDGILGSNTRALFESGWRGILIEPDQERYKNLKKNYSNHPEIITLNCFVETEGENIFDLVVDKYVDDKIDFCSIDVDGLDLDIFETIQKHKPTVVCIEGGQMLNPTLKQRLPPHISKHNIQQSLYVMNDSFEKSGYKLVCTYQDCFFVKKEYYHLFNVKDDLVELYLDGILSYPRIPWILNQISQVGLSNNILEYIMRHVPYCPPHTTSEQKSQWVDNNYSTICEVVKKIREKYHIEISQ